MDAALSGLVGEVEGVAADLSSAEGAGHLFASIPCVDILVNNLGTYTAKPFLDVSDDDWLNTLQVNLLSGVRVTRHYLPAMLERRWDRLLFVTSDSGVQIPADSVHYGVSKAAEFALARGIAETIPASGVTVNSLIPGATDTEAVRALVDHYAQQVGVSPEEFTKAFISSGSHSNLIQRVAETSEVAAMATYLCSELASATTGSPIRVDGGTLRSAF